MQSINFGCIFFKLIIMEIFGKYIFGNDAEDFVKLSILDQVQWIYKNTKQKNEDSINEFLANIPANNDKKCLNCGNISETIPSETQAVIVDNFIEKPSRRGNTKRGTKNKGA